MRRSQSLKVNDTLTKDLRLGEQYKIIELLPNKGYIICKSVWGNRNLMISDDENDWKLLPQTGEYGTFITVIK